MRWRKQIGPVSLKIALMIPLYAVTSLTTYAQAFEMFGVDILTVPRWQSFRLS